MNIHRDYGLWHAYRAALLFPVAFDLHLAVLETKALDRFKTKLGVNVNTARNYLANQAASVHLFQQRIPIRTTP